MNTKIQPVASEPVEIDEQLLWKAFDSKPKEALSMAIRGLHRLAAREAVAVPQLRKLSEDVIFEIWKQHETDNRFVFADAIMEVMLSAAPATPQAQPLMDDVILRMWSGDATGSRPVLGKNKVLSFARAIEAAHGITTAPPPSTPKPARLTPRRACWSA